MSQTARYLQIFLAVLVILTTTTTSMVNVQASPPAQSTDLILRAQTILNQMSPQERVGQLFLVTFKGRDVSTKTSIYDLVVNKHIGGVVLLASNDNFTGPDNTIQEAFNLNSSLQELAWTASQTSAVETGDTSPPQYIPLLIGISQEGDSYPNDQILNGLSPQTSLMAIGATWKPESANKAGQVLGSELSALGFNIFFGPSLDVLENITNETKEDLGTRTFGGDPYWVGQMGQAYIQGLHEGSSSRLAVIAKHFPGRGSSDRPPEDEVATVRKSLEQLKQIELAPFFDVTGNASSTMATTDGLLVSHIRYQGLQGNIRSTTKPVSFDAAALEQIMNLAQFSTWRSNGGVVISDDLGSQAVRRFYDPTGQSFDARLVARNALLAGNDLLYANDFIATGDTDAYTTMVRTLDLFNQKYLEDPAFAERVDLSVERIILLKLRLYDQFTLDNILPKQTSLNIVAQSGQVAFEIAQDAAALLSPSKDVLDEILGRPPALAERVVILTDSIETRQCSQCSYQYPFAVDGLQKAILRLYGPQAGGLVLQTKYSSYSYYDLALWLNGNVTDTVTSLETDLNLSDWIIFNSLDVSTSRPASNALRRFLDEKVNFYRNKKIIVFSYNTPYQLDATDISKVTAVYGLYSKIPAFVDTAARILFQEFSPNGASPVSIPGIGYDLINRMSPDPDQIIPLYLDITPLPSTEVLLTPESTIEPTAVPKFMVGDSLPLRTGVIIDHNGNQVPDGTVVRFTVSINGGETAQVIEATTREGLARTIYRIQSPGLLEFQVSSDPAFLSTIIKLDASAGEAVAITEIAPPSPTPTVTTTSVPTLTLTPSATPTPIPPPLPPKNPDAGDWIIAMLLACGAGAGAFWVGNRTISMRWGVRWSLLTAVGGVVAYMYLAANLPGSQYWYANTGLGGVALVTALGALIGWLGGWGWQQSVRRRSQTAGSEKPTSPR